jgi:hypothetical protein
MHQIKEQTPIEGQFLFFFYQRYLQNRRCVTKRIFRRPWFVNCLEQFTYPICGGYVAQMVNYSSLSKIKLPF